MSVRERASVRERVIREILMIELGARDLQSRGGVVLDESGVNMYLHTAMLLTLYFRPLL